MKYIIKFLLGLIICTWLNFHFILWCLWYLDHDWKKFMLRRWRSGKELNLDNGVPDGEHGGCMITYNLLLEEDWEDTMKRWVKLDLN